MKTGATSGDLTPLKRQREDNEAGAAATMHKFSESVQTKKKKRKPNQGQNTTVS